MTAFAFEALPPPHLRPDAMGHWFDKDLLCSECVISWWEHQRNPVACSDPKPLSTDKRYTKVQRTHCKRGHDLHGGYGSNSNRCGTCARIGQAQRAANAEKAAASGKCRNGHPLVEGDKRCKACRAEVDHSYYLRNTETINRKRREWYENGKGKRNAVRQENG